jgi:hypothetical protein
MTESGQPRRRCFPRWARIVVGVLGAYLLTAYVILPQVGKDEARKHPDLRDGARITHTAGGVPGDPLNVALAGTEEDIIRAVTTAGWYPADPLTFSSSVRIAVDTVFKKPDDAAPVSNLFLFGRKEDLAFEKPVGNSPRQRHHVRLWRSEQSDEGRPVWMGAATFDSGVELSHNTGQVTHHVSPDVDAERDLLIGDLAKAVTLSDTWIVDGFHTELEGRNGGGDPWHTDGRLFGAALPVSGKQPAK